MRNRVLTGPRGILVVAGAIIVLAIAAGVAYAAIPDSGGVIHGCYNTNNGQLRVIDPDAGDKCKTPESALSWSQTGPAGPTGPPAPSRRTCRARRACWPDRPDRRNWEPDDRPSEASEQYGQAMVMLCSSLIILLLPNQPRAVIIDDLLATRFFKLNNPIGQHIDNNRERRGLRHQLPMPSQ